MNSIRTFPIRRTFFSLISVLWLLTVVAGCAPGESDDQLSPGRESRMIDGKKTVSFDEALKGGLFPADAPLPSGIIWLPDGDSFIYRIHEDEGDEKRTMLYEYSCETGASNAIANWDAVQSRMDEMVSERSGEGVDDVNLSGRVNYQAMTLSHDGSTLMGVYNNDIYLYNLEEGDITFITDDSAAEIWPSFSPDDSQVAFARDRDIYVVDLATGQERQLTERENELIYNGVPDWVYDEEFYLRRAFWWSEDSNRIAFLQFDTRPVDTFPILDNRQTVPEVEMQQYPKAGTDNSRVRLGSIELTSGEITWVDTGRESDSYIPRVGWLPDSSKLWYYWVNRDQSVLTLNFADPATGESEEIIREEDEAWVEVRDDFTFVDENSFIWSSDRSGWRHLYHYDINGALLRQLTDGPWQVESVHGFNVSHTYLYFQSTYSSPMERQLHKIDLSAGDPEHLTTIGGYHSMNKAPAGDFYIGYFNDPTTPTRATIYDAFGNNLREFYDSRSSAMDDYAISYPEFFNFDAGDGTKLHAYMLKPVDFDEKKQYPVLVYIYGGPRSQAVLKRHSVSPWQQYLVNRGVILVRIDNRGTNARGRDFLKIVHRKLGEYELKDHVTGVEYLKTLPYIDGSRIAIEGYSYGGYMTLYALTKAPDTFHIGVSGSPVTDWRFYDTIYTERFMDRPQDNEEGYRESAPINFAADFKGELLITHGLMDNNVHFSNAVVMADKLIEAGKHFEFMIYPQERHGIRTPYRREHRLRMINDFYERYLLK